MNLSEHSVFTNTHTNTIEHEDNLSLLKQQLSTLNEQLSNTKKDISIIQHKIDQIERNKYHDYDVKQLEKMHEYLVKNKVHFGYIHLNFLSHATNSYDIGNYHYPLVVNNLQGSRPITQEYMYSLSDNALFIVDVKNPSNKIEEYLYPHVVNYLSSNLPIKLVKTRNIYEEDYFNLVPQTRKNVGFNMETSIAFVPILYLKSYSLV